ncbi:MAG: hypothetical protein JWO08_3986 [Verrucomicrobiaceae bacterium]|nr:hypothetical protein [Verrucomicrobiaceae bacterium]
MPALPTSNLKRLAKLITNHLRKRQVYPTMINVVTVQRLIETLFYTSLKTEESRAVVCTVVFGADLTPPLAFSRRLHRHTYIPLETLQPLTARNLAKFSHAALPWASCIAVHDESGTLQISGLFDQEIHHQNSLNSESGDPFPRPGLFQVEIAGAGTLTVYDNRTLLATLHQDSLVTAFYDVLNEGPVAKQLSKYVNRLEVRVKDHFKQKNKHQNIDSLLADAPRLWLQTLSRILLGIRRLKHGGALLLIPSKKTGDLSAKYPIRYDNMEAVLEQHLIASIRWQLARSQIRGTHPAPPMELIPAPLDAERRQAFNVGEDAKRAELGCANFIVSLGGVDGLILLSEGLRVIGFGVEIKTTKDPERLFSARDAKASSSRLKEMSFDHLGTRHRSMMRYCNKHPGSLGFVVSQDGDVRAITKTQQGLVVWENIRLQEVILPERAPENEDTIDVIRRRQRQIASGLDNSLLYEISLDLHEPLVQRKAWITASGDPLKIEIEANENSIRNTIQFYFHEEPSPALAVTRRERIDGNGTVHIEDTTFYFAGSSPIRIEIKTASFAKNESVFMDKVRVRELNPHELGDGPLHAESLYLRGNEVLGEIIQHLNLSGKFQEHFPDNDRYRLIQGTCAPNGRFAMGFGLADEVIDWRALASEGDDIKGQQYYLADAAHFESRIRNYLVEIKSQKILCETGCHYIGTRRRFNHRECSVIWSPNSRFLIQIFRAKWSSIEAIAGWISESGASKIIELMSYVTKRSYDYLRESKHRAYRRFGENFSLQIYSVDINNAGLVSLHVTGEIPKSIDADSNFILIERFRIMKNSDGLSLKFVDIREEDSTN